ncbi:hypothetical protein RPE78_15595 (plasmid) [Thioclava litoralis]|uniref:Uncharacterized protein n=1 Tax=Thioclava litoralis TaxID=3076557 RepID=A0ABZ1E460_9RHOB|nr:hypothetical protein RPE78_15595 [Thioclava sp. FTW29]
MLAEYLLAKVDGLVRKTLRAGPMRDARRKPARPHSERGELPRRGRLADVSDPLERACVAVILGLPAEERRVLELTYGLTGHLPCPPHRAADILGWGLAQTMTIGEAALLRLRNSARGRAAFAPLLAALHLRLLEAAQKIYDLRMAQAPRAERDHVLYRFWCDLTPVERLCLRGFGEGEVAEMRRALEHRAAGRI